MRSVLAATMQAGPLEGVLGPCGHGAGRTTGGCGSVLAATAQAGPLEGVLGPCGHGAVRTTGGCAHSLRLRCRPDHWLKQADEDRKWQFTRRWINCHVDLCSRQLRKPQVVAEFGKTPDGAVRVAFYDRVSYFQHCTKALCA